MVKQKEEQMGRVTVEIDLANNEDLVSAKNGYIRPDEVRRTKVQGVVDTGAARLVLPQSVVDQLGLPATGTTTVRYADHRKGSRATVGNVWLQSMGRAGIFSAVVEPKRTDALIGAIVLEELDLVVDCTTQRLHPRDPHNIITEIE